MTVFQGSTFHQRPPRVSFCVQAALAEPRRRFAVVTAVMLASRCPGRGGGRSPLRWLPGRAAPTGCVPPGSWDARHPVRRPRGRSVRNAAVALCVSRGAVFSRDSPGSGGPNAGVQQPAAGRRPEPGVAANRPRRPVPPGGTAPAARPVAELRRSATGGAGPWKSWCWTRPMAT